MRLLRVDDVQPEAARPGQQVAAARRHRGELREVVAEHVAEASGLEEVALHVDDDERGRRRREAVRIRPRVGDIDRLAPTPASAATGGMPAPMPTSFGDLPAEHLERVRLDLDETRVGGRFGQARPGHIDR